MLGYKIPPYVLLTFGMENKCTRMLIFENHFNYWANENSEKSGQLNSMCLQPELGSTSDVN